MKFTPLARLSLSSPGGMPSTMLGDARSSSVVKYHWLRSGRTGVASCAGDRPAAGEGALRPERGLGGDVREACIGGEGAAGGMSRRFVGDLLVGDLDERRSA
jgi:hypothetical protein